MRTKPPRYVEDAGVVGAPLDFAWKGALAHIGPVETVNKMFNLIGYKTTCGMLTQAAGIIAWGAWRLHGHTDPSVLLQMVEASFAFQVDPIYVDRNGADTRRPKENPPAESATGELQYLLWQGLNADKWWESYYQPHDSAYHPAYLVRHIMPKAERKAFSDWLEGMIARVQEVAPKPDEKRVPDPDELPSKERDAYYARHWGEALPPEILDLSFEYEHKERKELVDVYLRGLDWTMNPFLRTPAEMKALGFKGKPYELS